MVFTKGLFVSTLVFASVPVISANRDSDKSDETNLRGSETRRTQFSGNRLGRFKNVVQPDWLEEDSSSRFYQYVARNPHFPVRTANAANGIKQKHKDWRASRFPLQVGDGVRSIFQDQGISEIGNPGGDNSRGLYIRPDLLCNNSADVEEAMIISMESMMNEVDSSSNVEITVVIDVEELSLSNFVANPSCTRSWRNAYNVLSESFYPVNTDNIVAYPLSGAMTSAAKTLIGFARNDEVIQDTIQGTNDLNEVNVALGGTNAVDGGVRGMLRAIVPSPDS